MPVHEGGKVPDSKDSPKESVSSVVRALHSDGSGPVSLLLHMSMSCTFASVDHCSGIAPLKLFAPRVLS